MKAIRYTFYFIVFALLAAAMFYGAAMAEDFVTACWRATLGWVVVLLIVVAARRWLSTGQGDTR